MPGRHQIMPASRPRLRWLVGGAGVCLAGATMLALAPSGAGADGNLVTGTFSVTGVSTSNCNVSTGGSDVYVTPGAELDAKTSVIGVTLLGLPLSTSGLAGFDGKLIIDPSSNSAQTFNLKTTKTTKITGLSTGDHPFTWTATDLDVLGLALPLSLDAKVAKAGAALAYSGTIHVTSAAAKCGIAVQVPGVKVSASVTGLPPININLPGAKVTIPVTVPQLGGSHSSAGTDPGNKTKPAGGTNSTPPDLAGGIPIPAQVVPFPAENAGGGGGGYFPGALPDSLSQVGNTSSLLPVSASSSPATSATAKQKSTGKNKTIDLASNKAQSAQLPVVLAIIAIIALSLVAATYARLYLLRRTP
jgi:hypothetical protein